MERIEAIEILKELLDCNYIGSLSGEDIDALNMAINSLEVLNRAIIVPEDATNGDTILAVFPDTEHFQNNGIINTDIDDGTLFNADWWDAPYKRGKADE